MVVFTVTTSHFTAAAVLPNFTGLVAVVTIVPWVTHTLPVCWVAAAVCEVTVTSPVTAGSPPAWFTLTHTGTLVT